MPNIIIGERRIDDGKGVRKIVGSPQFVRQTFFAG
jgi:hypothetical protein